MYQDLEPQSPKPKRTQGPPPDAVVPAPLQNLSSPAEEEIRRPAFQLAIGLIEALLGRTRLIRLVGPDRRPLERHEFERHDQGDIRRLSGGWL